nr:MAG TPA: hypothetical protein [Caudoviricetes sp.]
MILHLFQYGCFDFVVNKFYKRVFVACGHGATYSVLIIIMGVFTIIANTQMLTFAVYDPCLSAGDVGVHYNIHGYASPSVLLMCSHSFTMAAVFSLIVVLLCHHMSKNAAIGKPTCWMIVLISSMVYTSLSGRTEYKKREKTLDPLQGRAPDSVRIACASFPAFMVSYLLIGVKD